ncbi:MAG: histidine phosphatase family protein [Anaerolineae bacterium]|nr:histidine phosphatase family protein [Anaerolineae bacterium]MBT7071059.1 histidine phosphatase family protein [Anaerolineae bacterium]MBT7323765.1 histidine phosphatase family protein [Anaerolineae bacterium]
MKIYLVRHAQAEWWKPDQNRHLTKQGYEDAKKLSDILQDYSIDAIYSSPYKRAHETIEPTAARLGLKIRTENDLRERNLGDISTDNFLEAVSKTWQDPAFAYPNGERNSAAQKRAVEVVKKLKIKHKKEAIILSSHGNIIALILQAFDPSIDFEFWKSLSMPDIHLLKLNEGKKVITKRLGKEFDKGST